MGIQPIAIHIDGWSKYITENAWPLGDRIAESTDYTTAQASGDFV